MASDVQKSLRTFYANLPSIFEDSSANAIKPVTDAIMTAANDNHSAYQPMFGSFLFAESEPFARAAFVDSAASSVEVSSTEDEQPTQPASASKANSNRAKESSPLASMEDLSDIDDDDDFDGIPLRHASATSNDRSQSDTHLLEQIAQSIEQDENSANDVEDLFLNGFGDEQHRDQRIDDTLTMPALFNNIPDIDDLNAHMDDEDDGDDRNRVPFDRMDMFDESDSIRSSSPDSVLSSSHLRDGDDDNYDDDQTDEEVKHNHVDEEEEDDVTQWNDDDLLAQTTVKCDRPNAPLPPPIVLNTPSNDQVDFIDSSRSNSRCSNASSHLSNGYTDQARIFINDEGGLVTSSDSESDEDEGRHENIQEEDDILIRDSDEELPLRINLDYDRSRSVSPQSSSDSRSDSPRLLLSPVPDQSPIVAIDEEIVENKKVLPAAPIANADDEDDDAANVDGGVEDAEGHADLSLFISDQPVFSPTPLKNLFELCNESRRNDIVHDIVNIRHLLDEHNDDDEFLAIIHNPLIFEQVLHADDHDAHEQKSDSLEQANDQMDTLQTFASAQFPYDNPIRNDLFERHQNIRQASLLCVSNNGENSPSNRTAVATTTPSFSSAVNHLPREEKETEEEDDDDEEEEEENVGVVNRSSIKLKKTQQSLDKNLPNINLPAITNCEKEQQDRYQMMDSDEESDNDSELLQTLAQLHGLVHTPRLSNDLSMDHRKINFNDEEKQEMNHATDGTSFKGEFTRSSPSPSALLNESGSRANHVIIGSERTSSANGNNSMSTANLFSNEEFDLWKKEDHPVESHTPTSFSTNAQFIINKLVSDTLQLAMGEMEKSYEPTEHFVERILSEAVYQVYQEDQNPSSIENLSAILHWHQQPTREILDPFDQKFDHLRTSHFQTPDDDDQNTNPNAFDQSALFPATSHHSKANEESPLPASSLFINPFTVNDSIRYPSTASVKNINTKRNSPFQDDFLSQMNESPPSPSSSSEGNEPHEKTPLANQEPPKSRQLNDQNLSEKHESFFQDQPPLSQFDDFPSEQPLHTQAPARIVADSGNPFDEPDDLRQSTNENDEPWELEEHGEESIKPIPTSVSQRIDPLTSSSAEHRSSIPQMAETQHEQSDSSESSDEEDGKENHNDSSAKYQTTETIEAPAGKTVRFDDNLQNITVFTPKGSLIQSEVSSQSSTSDSDESDDEQLVPKFETNTEEAHEKENFTDRTETNSTQNIVPRPDSVISLTSDDISFPPPLPPLPPLDHTPTHTNDNILSKSNTDLKPKKNSLPSSESPPFNLTTTDAKPYSNFESELMRPHGSAILRSTSNDATNIDEDEVNHTITCMIDNNEIKIDAKTISPFKCVINTAGLLHEDNQTAVIILYGCWLPDHRLREYRYIMDQLFYYVYHKLERLVTNDYVLVYFHGATPKHRTPELKFLRKCYQMINFRLRKNLRAVYVVHPTRWLRTIVALSRPFFSNKFYHKVQYLFTTAELEQKFPHNHIPIPLIIEQSEMQPSRMKDFRWCCFS